MGYAGSFDLSLDPIRRRDHMTRIDANNVSLDEFIEKYEKTYTPVVIQNAQQSWGANYKWSKEVSYWR